MRRQVFTWLLVLAIVAATGALAYACVPQATIQLDTPSVRPGDQVSGNGSGFAPTAPVEIGLNDVELWSGAPDVRGRFDFAFSAPRLEPGHYVVTAAPVGYSGEPARAVMEIVGASSEQPAGAGPAPNSPRTAPGEQPTAPASPQDRVGGQGDRGAGRAHSGAPGPESVERAHVRRGSTLGGGGSVDTASPGTVVSAREGLGSAQRSVDDALAAPTGAASRGGGDVSTVSERSASGDLWGGLESGRTASLLSGGPDAGPPGRANFQVVVGLALLVALAAGAGVAEVLRRRRRLAGGRLHR
jgi:hypothetical protein